MVEVEARFVERKLLCVGDQKVEPRPVLPVLAAFHVDRYDLARTSAEQACDAAVPAARVRDGLVFIEREPGIVAAPEPKALLADGVGMRPRIDAPARSAAHEDEPELHACAAVVHAPAIPRLGQPPETVAQAPAEPRSGLTEFSADAR